MRRLSLKRPLRDLQLPLGVQHEIKSEYVCVRGYCGEILGFMVSQRGIKVNLEKIWAIVELALPKTVKQVQSLNGKIAALNKFVSRVMNKCLPFFHILKRSFEGMDECQ